MSERSLDRRPFGGGAAARELHEGVSVWETKGQAATHARLFRETQFLVTLDGTGNTLASIRTTSVAGHRTVTAEPIEIYSLSLLGEPMPASANEDIERHWEVWSNESRNLIGCFSAEMKALIALEDAGRRSGSAYVKSLTLAMVGGSQVDAITGPRLLRHLRKPRD